MKKIIIKGEDLARIPLWKTLGKPKDDEEIVLYQLEDGESFPVDKPVKVQIAEKIKEVIQEKKNNIEEAIRNDDRYMKQCFDSELEAVEDLLERLQANNLSA